MILLIIPRGVNKLKKKKNNKMTISENIKIELTLVKSAIVDSLTFSIFLPNFNSMEETRERYNKSRRIIIEFV